MKELVITLLFLSPIYTYGQGEPQLNTDGIVFPSLTTMERDAIVTPVHGQVIFNETTQSLEGYDMHGWKPLNGGAIQNRIQDADNDSYVEVVESGNLDHITFFSDGAIRAKILPNNSDHTRIETYDRGDNVTIGDDAGALLNSLSGQNVIVGEWAGKNTSTGDKNVYLGYYAGEQNEEGHSNIAIGHEALLENVTADNNVAIGRNTLKNIDIDQESTTFGSNNVAIGTDALWAADRFTTGATAIGYGAGARSGSFAHSVLIGHKAGLISNPNYQLSNALYIANDEEIPLIYGEFDNKLVSIDGKLGIGKRALSGDNVDISNLAMVLEKGSNTAGQGIGIGFQSSSVATTIGGAIIFERTGSASKGHLHFATKSTSGTDEDIPIRMTLEDFGNLGIGITDPDAKLDINGDIIIRPSITSGGCTTTEDRGRLWFNDANGVLNLCTDALTPGTPGWVNLNFGL